MPRAVLMSVYKVFVRPHLDNGDIIYDKAYNETFRQKLESIQYNACLALLGAIKRLLREKFYHDLGLESHVKICLFYKIFKENKLILPFQSNTNKKIELQYQKYRQN